MISRKIKSRKRCFSISGHAQSSSSGHQAETVSQTSGQNQQSVKQTLTAPVQVPKPNVKASGGVQATSSFHSVSSIDSSAEMAKYFPDDETPTVSPYKYKRLQFLFNL